ncbi:DNA-directed RNA polymerase subunit beta [Candidatus Carsonella ruddii]|uniref:DNA-directed RNA polymerase subunit beta n=1 Tax=Carsonella ruddii TaxID=114186 RepID=A0A2K8K479_CARRU|nr:DNA-directed RNA polymerase subunit beta [Candidatus Carsonella ruddii]ATX33410.1 DNA-directed RNA polymerase subunit beta [Candidatus Carsonella ruddii]
MISFINFNRYCLSKKKFIHKCYKPYFNHIQINSYNNLLKSKYKNFSIKNIFKKHFPLFNIKKNVFLKFFKLIIKKPFFNEEYCKKKNIHFYTIIYVYFKIYIINKNLIFIKKFELGYIPYITNKGNFIINGTNRVLISQFNKAHGIFFFIEKYKYCKIIPYYGNWIEIINNNNIIYFFFDKKISFIVKNLLISLGLNKNFFFKYFFFKIKLKIIKGKKKKFFLINKKIFFKKKYKKYFCFSFKNIKNFYLGEYIFLKNNFFKKFKLLNNKIIDFILFKKILFLIIIIFKKEIENISIIKIYKNYKFNFEETNFLNKKGKIFNFLKKIFKKKNYNFLEIGFKRVKKILYEKNNNINILTIFEIIKKFLKFLKFDIINDSFESLENKYIYSSGKLLSLKFEKSLIKIIKNIKFKVKNFNNINDLEYIIEKNIITIELKDYFCNNELSQFLDQNNPLSEISHLRKISLIGNNIKKENCGFDIRDLHISHYCKICPIDTPEGHNIGLINSFSFYSKINKYNYISTIYKISYIGNIIGVIFLDYKKEKLKIITNYLSTVKTIYGEIFKFPFLETRKKNNYNKKKFFFIDLIEISGDQIVSLGASLIPFLSNNDANRCLMGSNMQRQAVPLINSDNSIVGTGNELIIGLNTRYNILSDLKGYILYLDNYSIIVKNNFKIKKYKIINFLRTNQNTVINQQIKINIGNIINKGSILADSNVTKNGEISLGKNIRVAFMSWYGYNFEDSILISDKILKKHSFSSFHIYEYVCVLKYNENGFDILSNDVFNKDQILNKKIKSGIIKIGEFVNSKEVLIGKMCPKNKSNFSPEEKLFKIVFSDNNFNYFEQPLCLPKNINGTVLNIDDFKLYSFKKNIIKILNLEQLKYVTKNMNNFLYEFILFYFLIIKKNSFNKKVFINNKIFIFNNNINILLNLKYTNKKNNYKIKIFKKILIKIILKKKKIFIIKKKNFLNYNDFDNNIIRIIKIKIIVKKKLKIGDKMSGRHGNKGVISNIVDEINMPYDKYGKHIELILNPLGVPSRMNVGQLLEVYLSSSIKEIKNIFNKINIYNFSFYKLKMIIKIIIKIIFNKNIKTENLNNFDCYKIFLNFKLKLKICVHNFYKINDLIIKNIINKLGFSQNGKIFLFDGITGIKYIKPINVGYIYFMKLNHLVSDKIYARSIGPYSMITQQPLGGKSNFGGQRLGEMEVWAIEAYGASHILKEMLTVKSDDIEGRTLLFKNIMKGIHNVDSGIPESFQVLLNEIKALCFDIKTI